MSGFEAAARYDAELERQLSERELARAEKLAQLLMEKYVSSPENRTP